MRLYLFVIAVSLLSCIGKPKTVTNDFVTGKDFYKRLEGSIGPETVEMHIQNHNGRFNGLYFSADGLTHNLWEEEGRGDTVYFAVSEPGSNWTEGIYTPDTLKLYFDGRHYLGSLIRSEGAAVAVKLEEKYPQRSQRLDVVSFSDSAAAFSDTASPKAEMIYSFLQSPSNNWINQTVKRIMETDSSLSFQDGFKKAANDYFTGYKKESAGLRNDSENGMPLATLNFSEIKDCNVQYNANGLLVIDYMFYTYTGGAHGMYGNVFYCLDVDQKKILALNDVLQADSTTMENLLEKHFRTQYNIGNQPLTSVLFNEKISATNNFYLNQKGIGFVYNPYDIAAYAMGPVNIFIPFSELMPYLTPAIKEKMKLK